MKPGLIVLLNGTSSSGKTSISKHLTKEMEQKFYYLSVDEYIKGIFKFLDESYPDVNVATPEDELKIFRIMLDPIITMYYSTIKAFSTLGVNVIVDTVLDHVGWYNTCIDLFKDNSVLYVGVKCSLPELQRREKLRGDRQIGLAQSQYERVHSYGEYDVEVDTEQMNPLECANQIIELMKSTKEFTAFKKLTKISSSMS